MSSPIPEGTVVNGKYRIERTLGAGGMGVVVAAMHLKLEQRVAIKFLLPEMLLHPEIVDRFLREARAASRIEGDHVARVMDVDVTESGAPFLVMEYLEGRDLSFVRRSKQPLPWHEAVGYVLEACKAVAEAHEIGIVHRDLKPANVFLARRRDGSLRVKVLDFGISKLVGGPGELGATQTGAVLGSAEYMSPEQMLASRDVDARADIWALGVVLYELCTARLPFRGESITHVAVLVSSSEAVPAITLVPTIPVGLDAIIRRCMAKSRDDRFADVRELMGALAPFSRPIAPGIGQAVSAPPHEASATQAIGTEAILSAHSAAAPNTTAGLSSGSAARAPEGPKVATFFAIGAVVLLGLFGAGAAFILLGRPAKSAAEAPPSSAPAVGASTAPVIASVSPAPTAEAPPAPATSAVASASAQRASPAANALNARPAAPIAKPKAPPPPAPVKRPVSNGID